MHVITHPNPEPTQRNEENSSEDDDLDYIEALADVHAQADTEPESNSDDSEVIINYKHKTPLQRYRVAPTSDEECSTVL